LLYQFHFSTTIDFNPEVAYNTRKCKTSKSPVKGAELPYTGGEIYLHLKGQNKGQLVTILRDLLALVPDDLIKEVDDHYGFECNDVSGQPRDLSGFPIRTETDVDTRAERSLNPNSGSSYVLHQRWKLDAKTLSKIPVSQQEIWMGRDKLSGDLLSPLPPASHAARFQEGSKPLPGQAHVAPYGTLGGSHGRVVSIYTNTPQQLDQLLDRMTGSDQECLDGRLCDDIFNFYEASKGQYFFMPSNEQLAHLATLVAQFE